MKTDWFWLIWTVNSLGILLVSFLLSFIFCYLLCEVLIICPQDSCWNPHLLSSNVVHVPLGEGCCRLWCFRTLFLHWGWTGGEEHVRPLSGSAGEGEHTAAVRQRQQDVPWHNQRSLSWIRGQTAPGLQVTLTGWCGGFYLKKTRICHPKIKRKN